MPKTERKEEVLAKLLAKANKNDGIISREYFEKNVPETYQKEIEEFLIEKDFYIMDEEIQIEENINLDEIVPKKYIGSSVYNFLKAVTTYKRLNTEDEQRLWMIVQKGREAKKNLGNAKDDELSVVEISSLNVMIEEYKKARETIIYSYHPFVLSIVNRYVRFGAGGNIDYEDLVQAGFKGLTDAFDRQDVSKENKLATTSRFFIMNEIQELIAGTRNAISVPKTAQYNRLQICQVKNKFEVEEGRKPTDIEIATKLSEGKNYSPKQIEKKAQAVRILLNSSKPVVDLDAKVDNDDEKSGTYGSFVQSGDLSPMDNLIRDENAKKIYEILKEVLTDTEIYIAFYRYGLQGCEKLTLEKIGEKLGKTRERIRQIEASICEKLRSSKYGKLLYEMYTSIPN